MRPHSTGWATGFLVAALVAAATPSAQADTGPRGFPAGPFILKNGSGLCLGAYDEVRLAKSECDQDLLQHQWTGSGDGESPDRLVSVRRTKQGKPACLTAAGKSHDGAELVECEPGDQDPPPCEEAGPGEGRVPRTPDEGDVSSAPGKDRPAAPRAGGCGEALETSVWAWDPDDHLIVGVAGSVKGGYLVRAGSGDGVKVVSEEELPDYPKYRRWELIAVTPS
ncbi:hypothetical protein AB0B89_20690 [Sphaerisporangium sp. NPDC049002]|uniref:hypothetical protein n=1 Tax=unclassified Sphaerisporangium TaxID=2630420 RepID=UPI0033F6CE9F